MAGLGIIKINFAFALAFGYVCAFGTYILLRLGKQTSELACLLSAFGYI